MQNKKNLGTDHSEDLSVDVKKVKLSYTELDRP
jgi:hypothetical protein